MKKIVLFSSWSLLFVLTLSGQDMISMKGKEILPEKGDWGIFFDALPFLKYMGNALSRDAGQSVSSLFPNGNENTLVLKKYKEETRALRIKLRLGFSTERFDVMVVSLGDTIPIPSVTDSKKISEQNIAVGVGFQKSAGKGRLRGYRGMELFVKFSSKTTKYTYGDETLTALVWTHTNTFGQGAGVLEVKEGNKVGLNLRYVIGAEYFFAPKMSVSAEYSWGINYFVVGEGKKVSEQWDFSTNKVRTTTRRIPKQPAFELDSFDAVSVNLALYF